jgi:hypothetical protein
LLKWEMYEFLKIVDKYLNWYEYYL